MAEENKNGAAKEEMGELFVSIGATGLGGLLKGLSSASAGFIAVKHAAETIVKPIANAGKSSVEIGKLNSQLGGTHEQLQQIQAFFKQKGLSEGLIEDIAQLQQYYAEFFRGKGFPDNVAIALGEMHIGWTEYTDSLESVLDLIQKIKDETSHMDKATRLSYLNEIGLSREWAYIFDRPDFDLSSLLVMKNKEVEKSINLQESINRFNYQFETAKNKLISNLDVVSEGFKFLSDNLVPFVQGIENLLNSYTNGVAKVGQFFGNIRGNSKGNEVIYPSRKIKKQVLKQVQKQMEEEQQRYYTNSINPSSTIPSSSQNTTVGNVTINNHNEIKSDSPSAVVREIENMNGDQVERNLYEITNRPGR